MLKLILTAWILVEALRRKSYRWILVCVLMVLYWAADAGFLRLSEFISMAGTIKRLILLVLSSQLLTLTTSPIRLTDGLESLMKPLKKIRFPAHEIAMMMSIALRFIPLLVDETDKIMTAQKARGADFSTGSLVNRAKALIPVLIPLFVSAFRRAEELAIAMECRCYVGGEGRTKMKVLKLSFFDVMFFALLLLLFALIPILGRISLSFGGTL